MRAPLWTLALAAPLASGCIAFNEQCQGLVENPTEPIGYLAEEVFLDRPNARHGNNAIGQLAADAFVDAFSKSNAKADLAVLNGGAIRAEGLCVTRNILRKGDRVTRGLLHEILLFENVLMAVDLDEEQLVKMFEHSASRLFAKPAEIISPSGIFLHVSAGTQVTVQCNQPVGSRIAGITINGQAVQVSAPRKDKLYRVAMPSFLLNGGDGYSMVEEPGKDPARNPAQAQEFGGLDNAITANFMKRTYNESEAKGLKLDPGRLLLNECKEPSRPQG